MSYIGKSPSVGNFVKLDALTASATASYTMQLNSVNFTPESVNHMLVSLNGVIQAPTTSFTISGSTLTFASTLASSDSIDFIMVYGNVLDIGTPSDNTVSQAKLVNEAVNEAKLQVSNSPTNGYFLSAQSGNTGGLTWAESSGGGITEADQWRLTTNFTANSGGNDLTANWERDAQGAFDKLGTGMTESSGIFSFPSTGYWLIIGTGTHYKSAGYEYATNRLYATVNNSSYASVAASAQGSAGTGAGYSSSSFQFVFDVENTTNCKVKWQVETSVADVVFMGNTDENWTWWNFIRLGDT